MRARFVALSFAVGLSLASCSKHQEHPNVILIVVDTLRADRLGCYGYSRPTSPRIDALASEGTLFTDCVAQAPWTLASMSSMLVGRYLTQHREWPDPRYVPLAECFRDAGYATVGVSANVLLAKDHHFDRGFDHYDASWGPADNDGKPFSMLYDAIWPPVEKALAAKSGAAKKPLFLFLQPFDPHFSYKAHPEFDHELPPAGAEPVQPIDWQAQTIAQWNVPGPENDPDWGDHLRSLTQSRGLYEQEVRYTDLWVGKVLDRLRELGALDDAVVAIVSDHGEGLWQHVNSGSPEFLRNWIANPQKGPDGFFFQGHSHHVYEEAIRTPFILWGRGVKKGERRDEPVENVDLYPTLCKLAGIAPPANAANESQAQLQGRDLTQLLGRGPQTGAAWRERSFSFVYQSATVREHATGLKLIAPTCSYRGAEFGVPLELFDLRQDPDERRNLAPERPDDVKRLLGALQRVIADHPTVTTWNLKQPEENATLRKLGYDEAMGSAPDPNVICGDVKDH